MGKEGPRVRGRDVGREGMEKGDWEEVRRNKESQESYLHFLQVILYVLQEEQRCTV